jgi:hypothetical protein
LPPKKFGHGQAQTAGHYMQIAGNFKVHHQGMLCWRK